MFLDSFEVFDLALGKPALYCLPSNATLGEALELSKELNLSEISVWDEELGDCVGVVNALDILCFLTQFDPVSLTPEAAFSHPISSLLHKASIQRVNLHDRLTKALEMVAQGVQFLIVPLPTCMKKSGDSFNTRWPRKELCWISQEAVMRFMMSCIAAFCPVPLFGIDELGIINREFMFVEQQEPAIKSLDSIRQASQSMSAVAVVQSTISSGSFHGDIDGDDEEHQQEEHRMKLVGDISTSSLRNCDETIIAGALTALSAAEFLSLVQGGSKRTSRILGRMLSAAFEQDHQPIRRLASSLETSSPVEESSDSELDHSSSSSSSSRKSQRQRGCLTCRPWSSLAAVMAQALAHQSAYIWVTEADNTIVGIVKFVDIIRVLIRRVDGAGRSGSTQKLFSSTPKLVVSR